MASQNPTTEELADEILLLEKSRGDKNYTSEFEAITLTVYRNRLKTCDKTQILENSQPNTSEIVYGYRFGNLTNQNQYEDAYNLLCQLIKTKKSINIRKTEKNEHFINSLLQEIDDELIYVIDRMVDYLVKQN